MADSDRPIAAKDAPVASGRAAHALTRTSNVFQRNDGLPGWIFCRRWYQQGHPQSGLGCFYPIEQSEHEGFTEDDAMATAKGVNMAGHADEALLSNWIFNAKH